MDILLVPFDKVCRASGISAFDKAAVVFHFKGSLRGMALGLIRAMLVGLPVPLF